MLEQRIQQQFFDSADLKFQTAETLCKPIADAAGALIGAVTGGGKVMVCGCDLAAPLASHLASLFVDGFERERPPLPAITLLAASAPDKQIHALGQAGDVLLLLAAGERGADLAQSVIAAARAKDMTVVFITGNSASQMIAGPRGLVETDVMITVPHDRPVRVLELQLLVLHCLCDAVDLQLMGEHEP